MYQVVLGRYIQLITGATAYAVSATLVAFMLGTSAGAALGGRWSDRVAQPLRLYAFAELAVGAYCAAFPWLFALFEDTHLALVGDLSSDSLALKNAVRFTVAAAAFLVPAFAMGVTTPAFARAVAQDPTDRGRWLARLYGWNTLGAALGALTTAYVLVPILGMVASLWIGATINAVVAAIAVSLSKTWRPTVLRAEGAARQADESHTRRYLPGGFGYLWSLAVGGLATLAFHSLVSQWLGDQASPHLVLRFLVTAAWLVLLLPRVSRGRDTAPTQRGLHLVAFLSGLISFGLEVIWTHTLAILLGNSVYSFGLMLGSLLAGLSIGAAIARSFVEPSERARRWLGLAFLLGGGAVLWTIELWDLVPGLFLALAHHAPSFALMEILRFGVAMLLMLLPTIFLGIAFPLALRTAAGDQPGVGASVGRMYSVNAVGAILGSLLAAYGLLPWVGSLSSLKLLASSLLITGAGVLWWMGGPPTRAVRRIVPITGLAWCLFVGASWDFQRLNTAAAIYLGESGSHGGKLIYQREDAGGGLTTVIEREGVKTLLTNGKFQGDDAAEIPIQHRLAHLPALFTAGRERALVIGLGTGVTLAALASHGFDEVVCAEISPAIVEAARLHFGDANDQILESPDVRLVEEDGRSVLRESPKRYDVVSVQITTIWFAGVGNIYSEEFYSLVARRLRRNGLLLQWFPVHHLSARNLFVVVNTARSVFPYVSVWRHKHQGFLVASLEPQRLDLASIRADDQRSQTRPYLELLRSGSLMELVSDLAVADRDSDRFLDSLAQLLRLDRDVVSTDSWPTLEYETPKDVLDNMLYFQNTEVLRRFRSSQPPGFRGEPSEREEQLATAAFSLGWHDERSIPRLAALADLGEPIGATALEWLALELAGDDGRSSAGAEYRAGRGEIASVFDAATGDVACEPVPRPFSRPLTVPMALASHDGTVLDLTPDAAVGDGVVDPATTRGLVLRAAGLTTTLAFELDAPTALSRIGIALKNLDGHGSGLIVTGRLGDGTWRLLASGAADEGACAGAHVVAFAEPTQPVEALRISIRGEVEYQRFAVYEVWADAADAARGRP